MNDPTTFLDFFSDVGGLRKDFELCGMVCKGHREIDKFADRSFRAIYDIKEDEWYAEDIAKVASADLPEINLWAGVSGKAGLYPDEAEGTADRVPELRTLRGMDGAAGNGRERSVKTVDLGTWYYNASCPCSQKNAISRKKQVYEKSTTLYCRISLDDGADNESMSISNRKILIDVVKKVDDRKVQRVGSVYKFFGKIPVIAGKQYAPSLNH